MSTTKRMYSIAIMLNTTNHQMQYLYSLYSKREIHINFLCSMHFPLVAMKLCALVMTFWGFTSNMDRDSTPCISTGYVHIRVDSMHACKSYYS